MPTVSCCSSQSLTSLHRHCGHVCSPLVPSRYLSFIGIYQPSSLRITVTRIASACYCRWSAYGCLTGVHYALVSYLPASQCPAKWLSSNSALFLCFTTPCSTTIVSECITTHCYGTVFSECTVSPLSCHSHHNALLEAFTKSPAFQTPCSQL